jgi:uncharacterized protein
MSGPTWNGRAQIDIAQVEQILIDQQSALQKLQSGEVAALVRVVGKPVDFFNRIPRNSGLHLIPIPFTSRFAERLFSQWDQFLAPPRHPKWRDVNLSATVPGWTRHIIAEQMLGRFYGPAAATQEDISRDFQAFLDRIGTGAPQSQTDREALFREFLQWRAQQGGRRR